MVARWTFCASRPVYGKIPRLLKRHVKEEEFVANKGHGLLLESVRRNYSDKIREEMKSTRVRIGVKG
ncbi:hypothetical protein NPIL_692071 [Nephila pilipes]|uniref:Uncharacterized protein n=1 Tax=Nephila pilipes TaxID=299642 RepID=A0A8X6P0A1_NEPPI|nr:hypothetical protein NPIL_692071 [Nephila pilipes]